MKNIGFVFAGQGSQTTGMGSDLYNNFQEAREVYDFLEEDLKKISFEGSIEEISDTRNLQPLMVALELSILKILVSKGVKPVATCGLSLGEYAALRAAEIVNEKEILEAITVRGQAMAEAAKTVESGMAAVMNLSYDEIQSIVKEVSQNDSNVYISNLNSSRQIVIAGHKDAVDGAVAIMKEKGGRVIPLKVSGAFHTPYMESAVPALKEALEKWNIKKNTIDYYGNRTGKKYKGEDLVTNLCEQMTNPVRLLENLKGMQADGTDTFVEIGPGKTLSSIIKKDLKGVETFNVSNVSELENFIEIWRKEINE